MSRVVTLLDRRTIVAVDAPKRIAVALGSGGARGYAHIGVIEVLEERGFEIVSIAGSSMGALVGGLRAADRLDEYTEWARSLTQFDVLRLLDLSLSAPGAIRAGKIFVKVRELLGDVLIEDLPIPYTAVATDLLNRKEVWFQRGPLDVAIRASVAIPSIITPLMLNGRLLADGGLMNPVPIAPTASVQADATVAVSLNGEHAMSHEDAPALESAEEGPVDEWVERFRRGASRLLDGDMVRSLVSRFGSGGDTTPEPDVEPAELLPAGLGKFDVMNLSLEAMQSVLTRYRFAGYPPDVLVSVPKDACRSLDYHRAADMIELGRTLTIEALDRAGMPGPIPPARGRGGAPRRLRRAGRRAGGRSGDAEEDVAGVSGGVVGARSAVSRVVSVDPVLDVDGVVTATRNDGVVACAGPDLVVAAMPRKSSFPPKPSMVSLPAKPRIWLARSLPPSTSAPAPPTRFSTLPATLSPSPASPSLAAAPSAVTFSVPVRSRVDDRVRDEARAPCAEGSSLR